MSAVVTFNVGSPLVDYIHFQSKNFSGRVKDGDGVITNNANIGRPRESKEVGESVRGWAETINNRVKTDAIALGKNYLTKEETDQLNYLKGVYAAQSKKIIDRTKKEVLSKRPGLIDEFVKSFIGSVLNYGVGSTIDSDHKKAFFEKISEKNLTILKNKIISLFELYNGEGFVDSKDMTKFANELKGVINQIGNLASKSTAIKNPFNFQAKFLEAFDKISFDAFNNNVGYKGEVGEAVSAIIGQIGINKGIKDIENKIDEAVNSAMNTVFNNYDKFVVGKDSSGFDFVVEGIETKNGFKDVDLDTAVDKYNNTLVKEDTKLTTTVVSKGSTQNKIDVSFEFQFSDKNKTPTQHRVTAKASTFSKSSNTIHLQDELTLYNALWGASNLVQNAGLSAYWINQTIHNSSKNKGDYNVLTESLMNYSKYLGLVGGNPAKATGLSDMPNLFIKVTYYPEGTSSFSYFSTGDLLYNSIGKNMKDGGFMSVKDFSNYQEQLANVNKWAGDKRRNYEDANIRLGMIYRAIKSYKIPVTSLKSNLNKYTKQLTKKGSLQITDFSDL